MARKIKLFAVVVLVLLAGGCATTESVKQIDRLAAVSDNPTILIMTPDVKYYLLTAGGVAKPHAEWTEAARINFSSSLVDYATERGTRIKILDEDDQLSDAEIQYHKLYSAVGASILLHHFNPALKLPTKSGSFDWSMGPGVKKIAEKYEADYALFSYYRDYQASEGRVALAVLSAVIGVGVPAGSESGYASLIDLQTGDIVWFNQLVAGKGELRNEDEARPVIDALFKDLPES